MMDIFFIAGTTVVTVAVNLNVAVLSFTGLYCGRKRFVSGFHQLPAEEIEGFGDED